MKPMQRFTGGAFGWRCWSAVPLLLVAVGPEVCSPQELPGDSVVHRILADRVALGRNPGIVVGLLDAQGPRVVAFGTSGKDGIPLDGSTIFEIGSVTKVFTAAVLQDMVQRGEVSFDDPVRLFLPTGVMVPNEPDREITLLDLATHQSGLPRMPSNFAPENVDNPYVDYAVEDMYAFITGYQLQRPIGAEWEYSNLGMGLLGHVLALKSGTTYGQLVAQRILQPLGMNQTTVRSAGPDEAPFAQGHGINAEPVPYWDIPTFAGAGALSSTVLDLLIFAAANLLDANPVLYEVFRETHEIRIPDVAPHLSMALGWLVSQRFPDRPIIWHNGGTGGFHSFLGLDTTGHRAVVVLTNGAQSIDDIGFHLLDARSPLTPPSPLRGPLPPGPVLETPGAEPNRCRVQDVEG